MPISPLRLRAQLLGRNTFRMNRSTALRDVKTRTLHRRDTRSPAKEENVRGNRAFLRRAPSTSRCAQHHSCFCYSPGSEAATIADRASTRSPIPNKDSDRQDSKVGPARRAIRNRQAVALQMQKPFCVSSENAVEICGGKLQLLHDRVRILEQHMAIAWDTFAP